MKYSVENVSDYVGQLAPFRRRVNTVEAARYVGLSVSQVNKLRHYGRGPKYYRLGVRVVYDLADLDAWVASCAQINTSQNQPFTGGQ